jgi:hypothetical protein
MSTIRTVGEGPSALTFRHADEPEQKCSGLVPGTEDPCLDAPVLTIEGQEQVWHFCRDHAHILGEFL